MAMTHQRCWHGVVLPAGVVGAPLTARPRAAKQAGIPVDGFATATTATYGAAFAVNAFAVTRRRSAPSPG